jgi:hypothetical protein
MSWVGGMSGNKFNSNSIIEYEYNVLKWIMNEYKCTNQHYQLFQS